MRIDTNGMRAMSIVCLISTNSDTPSLISHQRSVSYVRRMKLTVFYERVLRITNLDLDQCIMLRTHKQ